MPDQDYPIFIVHEGGKNNIPNGMVERVALMDKSGSPLSTWTEQELSSRFTISNTFALIGDSITAFNAQTGTTPSFARAANGWFWHANAALGNAMTTAGNFAISGKRADEILAEQVPQVLALNPLPKFCTVLAGTNDLTAGATATTIQTRLLAIYDALNAAGIHVIACTILPRATFTGSITTINRWMKSLAGTRRNFHVVDWSTPLAATTGDPASGVLYDGLHPSHSGASIMGAVFAQSLTGRLLPVDGFPIPGDTANLLTNPFMTGTGGSLGSGVTGNVATGWTLARGTGTPVVAGAKIARTDGIPGEWQQITATQNAPGDFVNFSAPVTVTGMAVGDRLRFVMEIETDAQTSYPHLWLQFNSIQQNSSAGGGMSHMSQAVGDTYTTWARMPRSAFWVSQPWTVPVGTTLPFQQITLFLRIFALTGNAIRVGRTGFYNLGPAT